MIATWLKPGKLSPMLTLFFMMLGCEKLILRLWRRSACSGDVKQEAVLHMRPGTMLSAPGLIRCSGTNPPPDEGEVGDRLGLDDELTVDLRSPVAPRPEPGLAALSQALYCCPGPFRCSEPRSLRPEPGLGKFPSLFCDHIFWLFK